MHHLLKYALPLQISSITPTSGKHKEGHYPLLFFTSLFLIGALTLSCEKEQYLPEQVEEAEQQPYQEPPCVAGQCQNGSICLDGTCDCPRGYTGKFCEFRTGTFTDTRDNSRYKWVTLRDGNKWMAQSLKYRSPQQTYYSYDDRHSLREQYGALYPWYSIMSGDTSSNINPSGVQGICPEGWHVPSADEWSTMIDLYGGVYAEYNNDGRAAYYALVDEGYSGLNLQFGGQRTIRFTLSSEANHTYWGNEEWGYYWSSTSDDELPFSNDTHSFTLGEEKIITGKSSKFTAKSCRCIEN